MTKAELQSDKQRCTEHLLKLLPPGATVYTTVHHVSRSGMSRSISLHVVNSAGEVEDISGMAACLIKYRLDHKRGGIKVGGCGMDMGFHLVYNLGRTLYPNGWSCVGKGCRQPHWRTDYHPDGAKTYHKTPRGKRTIHSDGGYALNHRWL